MFRSPFAICLYLLSLTFVGCDSSPRQATPTKTKQADSVVKAETAADEATVVETAKPKVMTIGTKAPALDIEHWVSDAGGKFKPNAEFSAGHVYVVEFWATWCGPCISSMPHLVETQSKYLDQNVQIISISKEDLETVETFLQRDYQPRGEKAKSDEEQTTSPQTYADLTAAYCLTSDPDESVYQDYFRAAGRNGIPCAFIVGKTGVIEWIGHPMAMDDALEQVVEDGWDRDSFAKAFRLKQKRDLILSQIARSLRSGSEQDNLLAIEEARQELADDAEALSRLDSMKAMLITLPLQAKLRDGKNTEALELIEGLLSKVDASMQQKLMTMKLTLQLKEKKFDDASATLRTLSKEESFAASTLNGIAWQVYEMSQASSDLPKELVVDAIAVANRALEEDAESPGVLDTLAHLQYSAGDLDAAIETQTKAVANSKTNRKSIEAFLAQLKEEKELKDNKDSE